MGGSAAGVVIQDGAVALVQVPLHSILQNGRMGERRNGEQELDTAAQHTSSGSTH